MVRYNRISSLLIILDNQVGFKKKLGTEMCVFALNQYLTNYNNNTNINNIKYVIAYLI